MKSSLKGEGLQKEGVQVQKEATWRPLGAHLEAKWSPSALEVHLKGENAPRAGEELILEGLRRHLKGENAPRAGEELILEGVQVHLKYT